MSYGARGSSRDWLLLLIWVAALVGLRVAQLLSEQDRIYDQEYTEMGRLALDVADGSVQWTPLHAFIDEYQYGYFAPGTLLVQFMTVLFSVPFGPHGFALIATSIAFEALLLGVWIYCGRLMMPRWLVCLSALPLVLAPWPAVRWQLLPFANHTEFLWIPVLVLAACVGADQRKWWHWLGLVALVSVGILLYRLTLTSAVGLAAVGCALGSKRRWLAIAVVAAVLGGVIVTRWVLGYGWMMGFSHMNEQFAWSQLSPLSFVPEVWEKMPQLAHSCWGNACWEATAPKGWNLIHKTILLAFLPALAVVLVLEPRARAAASFALGWCLAAMVLPSLFESSPFRYFVSTYYALLACGLVALGMGRGKTRIAIAIGFGLLTIGGLDAARRHVHTDRWATNLELDTLALGQRLGVWYLDDDDLPYYVRMIDERRFDPCVGSMPYPPELTPTLDVRYPAEPLPEYIQNLHERVLQEDRDTQRCFEYAGRGAWISGNRDLERLWEFWTDEGITDPYLTWMWEGALAEAAHQGGVTIPP